MNTAVQMLFCLFVCLFLLYLERGRVVPLTHLGLAFIGQLHMVCGSSCVSRYSPKSSGSCIEASQCTGAALPGLCTNNPGTICCIPNPIEGDTVIVRNRYVSRTTFYDMFGKTRRSTSLYPYYIKALDDAGISTPEQIAAFTAQVGEYDNYE